VQARSGRIEPDVRDDALSGEKVGQAFRVLGNQPTPFELVEQVGHRGAAFHVRRSTFEVLRSGFGVLRALVIAV
jgi:hypothetical protein